MDETTRWFRGEVIQVTSETPSVKSFKLKMSNSWPGHLAGQHVDLRLTAPDGYQAVRAYSLAAAPNDQNEVELTVQMIEGGEVSAYLDTKVKAGDQLEITHPIGTHFVWRGVETVPVTLIGGGSGIVPLISMMRHHHQLNRQTEMRLLYSIRTASDIIYKSELCALVVNGGVTFTITDEQPVGWNGYSRRIDRPMLTEFCGPIDPNRLFYVCGPTPMVEAVATGLTDLGYNPQQIKTERFGPTG